MQGTLTFANGDRERDSGPIFDIARTIVSCQDKAVWKRRLAVSDENRTYLFLLGTDDHIRWSNSAVFTDSEYTRLKIELLLALASQGRRKGPLLRTGLISSS